jgi:hypothetical protein
MQISASYNLTPYIMLISHVKCIVPEKYAVFQILGYVTWTHLSHF